MFGILWCYKEQATKICLEGSHWLVTLRTRKKHKNFTLLIVYNNFVLVSFVFALILEGFQGGKAHSVSWRKEPSKDFSTCRKLWGCQWPEYKQDELMCQVTSWQSRNLRTQKSQSAQASFPRTGCEQTRNKRHRSLTLTGVPFLIREKEDPCALSSKAETFWL